MPMSLLLAVSIHSQTISCIHHGAWPKTIDFTEVLHPRLPLGFHFTQICGFLLFPLVADIVGELVWCVVEQLEILPRKIFTQSES